MNLPLVTVITPTWFRPDMLFSRCIPSVAAQTYQNIEHVIVHDGPYDDDFRHRFMGCKEPGLRYLMSLDEHEPYPHWGGPARRFGLERCTGEYITYLDDDDAFRPDHVQLLVQKLMDDPILGWVYSRMVSHAPSGDHVIGDCVPPVYGQIGSPMIMHRRQLIAAVANWGAPDAAEDWKLVEKWLAAGIKYAHVDADTVDVYPSAYAGLA